ncbi:MAG: EF-hand domain-containing protein [Sphingomicrobium sp.]
MKMLLVGAGVAALVFAAGPATAQPAPPPAPGVFSQAARAPVPPAAPQMQMMMMRSDRPMTRDEAVRHVRDVFTRLDANRDGYLTRVEIDSIHTNMMGAMRADSEKRRGDIPRADRGKMFDRLDANHNGSISRQEYMAAQPQLQERRVVIMRSGPDAAPRAPGAPGMKMGMHGMGMGFGGRMFDMADSNRDGRLSLAEAQQAALQHFDRADLNHDGTLTREERQQAHQLRQQHRPS